MITPVVHRRDVEPSRPRTRAPGRPHVAVLVSLNFPDLTEPVAELIRRFTRNALDAVTAADASYELIDSSDPEQRAPAGADADALWVLGGGDIAPSCYGNPAPPGPSSYGVDETADRLSIALIRGYEAAGRPVLGICRGAQLINVAHGGTIIDDIPDSGSPGAQPPFTQHHGTPGGPLLVDEKIEILPGTRLASIVGDGALTVRSGHHQAADQVGDGLIVAARALDGIAEAVEDPGRWTLGVQFHPEDDHGAGADGRELRLLADALVAAARLTLTRG